MADLRYTPADCRWHRDENLKLARICLTSGLGKWRAEAVERAWWWHREAMAGGISWQEVA